ncbi:hypothetical protein EHS25_007408 [Saitozyma podzolica]|uniref:Transaldolase n=1 Tax=Saitozyma podzolica TaxID=1890683 RepID=A0A427YPQ9_9TREE|nr:hypothetical protein EHS25_007408 [Saitozyma podzolica]
MIQGPQRTLLEQLASYVAVDADTLEVDYITSLPITPHDVTSNPRFVHDQLADTNNKEMVEQVVKELKDAPWEEIYAVITSKFGARVIPHISGRVLAQVLPSQSYDTDAMVKQARTYVKCWNAEGIPTERTCVKIPMTEEGAAAAAILSKEGIFTLGTCLFSIPQAIAASQAGMHAVSMYWNEPLAGSDATLWPDVADPATEHPMAARHYRIRKIYDRLKQETGKRQPQIKTASFISVRECLAMVELGADHITIGRLVLEDLCMGWGLPKFQPGLWKVPVSEQLSKSGFEWEAWAAHDTAETAKRMAAVAETDPMSSIVDKDWLIASAKIDYLAPGVLSKFNEDDPITRDRLKCGLARFSVFEGKSKTYIEEVRAGLA